MCRPSGAGPVSGDSAATVMHVRSEKRRSSRTAIGASVRRGQLVDQESAKNRWGMARMRAREAFA